MLLALACSFLGACASALQGPPTAGVQISEIPIAEPCAADPGPRPEFPDTSAAITAAPDIFERAKLYASGRQMRLDWEARLEAAVAGCRGASRAQP
ncbi:MAG TPA: hypothetical protein VJP88_09630 [Caulobacteraceae bacterium]|nr:hypothetical protein [Caulobacteraceae bacterium]